MAKIELKQPVVEEIKENIKDAKSVVLVDYRGLTVDQDTQLRKSMREADVNLQGIQEYHGKACYYWYRVRVFEGRARRTYSRCYL
mgnify:CR=1 FL=1